MCGIGGIIKSKGLSSAKYLNIAKSIMYHQSKRGPDSNGIYEDESCVLIHNRLSIIDLSESGSQPMRFGDWIIVYNGEIYNYKSLKEELLSDGERFDGSSDTEVLIKLISKYGVEVALGKCNGIFSLCAYNKRSKEFFLARDRMGEKPLFYHVDNYGNIYFASNPGSIAISLKKKWSLDKECLWEFFAMGGVFSEKTLFEEIKRVDSAQVLKIKNGKILKSYYWEPKYTPNLNRLQLKDLIRDSIMMRTVSDVPVSLFLSGGIDSSTVASVIKNIDAVHLDSKELPQAKYISDLFKMNMQVVKPESLDLERSLFEYSKFSGEATMAGFIPYVVSKNISSKYKVAISANAADELFFGYTRIPTPKICDTFYDKLTKNKRININLRACNNFGQIQNIFRDPDIFSVPILGKKYNSEKINSMIDLEVSKLKGFPYNSRYRWIELMTYVKGDLNNTLDFASMANSLEVRAPFLDYRLVEAALSLDETFHITEENGRKAILKEMLAESGVDKEIWDRNKIGFSLNANYIQNINSLRISALNKVQSEGYLKIDQGRINLSGQNYHGRDLEYLKSAAFGFYCWKKFWIDQGIVKK